jgi:hypothetical protein
VTMAQDYPTLTAAPMPADPDPQPAGQDAQPASHQPCDTCGAPLDERQRYCLACGTRRKHTDDPAARFLAAATRRRRTGPAVPRAAGAGRRSAPLASAAAVAAIPLALGLGVLIGRSSGGGDGKLIAALRAEKAPVIQYSGSGTGGATATAAAAPKAAVPVSTFALSKGYAVELGTLPSGASAASAKRALQADKTKGASGVGLLSQSTYTVTPSPPSGAYVLYAGSYSTRAAAEKALGRFKHHFPAAKVIEIQSAANASSGGGKVLNKTVYGAAHQVTGFKPTSQSLKQGAQVAQQDSHDTGKAASGAGLPDVVSVP